VSTVARSGDHGSRGQGLVEFALVVPLFFLLLLGTVEFGRAVYTIEMLNNAAREGARYAIVHGAQSACPSGPMPNGAANYCDPSGANVRREVRTSAIGIVGVNPANLVVTTRWCSPDAMAGCTTGLGNGDNGRDQAVWVQISYSFTSFVPLVPLPSFTLTGGSTLVVNH
jgi:Flp pilus assembly protein TadG